MRSTQFIKQALLLALLILSMILMSACQKQSPIAAVTPIALDSAENTIINEQSVPAPAPTEANFEVDSSSGMAVQVLPKDDEVGIVVASEDEPSEFFAAGGEGLVYPETEPTPLPIPEADRLDRGVALKQSLEEDRAWEVEPVEPVELDGSPVVLKFDDFFVDYDPWDIGGPPPNLSDKLLALDGQEVIIEGYMTPPLQFGLDWFMLTRVPLGYCPFHSSVATWPPDIMLVYLDGPELPFSWEPMRIKGELHVGGSIDPVTGMASLIRLYTSDNDVEIITFSQ